MRARIELDSHFLSRWTEYFLLVLAQFSAGQFPPSNLPPGQYSLRSIITHIYNLYISFYFMVIGKTKASQTGKLYRGKIFPRKMLPKVSYLPIIWSESRASYLFEVCHKKKKYIHIYRYIINLIFHFPSLICTRRSAVQVAIDERRIINR